MNLCTPASLATTKEPNVFNRRFIKLDGASFNQIANEIHIVHTLLAVTHGKELLRHPVVEQLAMIASRLATPAQGHQKSTNELRWHDS